MIYFNKPQTQLLNFGPWVEFEKFLSQDECSKIIAQMPDRKMNKAEIGEKGVLNPSIRNNRVCNLDFNEKTQWIFQKLEEAIKQCNDSTYGYELLGFFDAIQLLEYHPGDFYDWHMDFGNLQFSHRKLSVVIQLTPAYEYEGGTLEFFNNGTAPKDQGSLIMFPSFMYHRVNPITKGLRRSLVAWISGHPYK